VIASLAQLISLVAYGNAFVHGLIAAPELTGSNWSFRYVRFLRFDRHSHRRIPWTNQLPTTIARNTSEWFERLRNDGVTKLGLNIAADTDYKMAGFAGAVPATILTNRPDRREHWVGSWTVISPKPSDDLVWDVVYESVPLTALSLELPTVPDMVPSLRSALEDARDIAVGDHLDQFKRNFVEAIQFLDGQLPATSGPWDLLPDVGFSVQARKLLAASTRAWVFGGMGWWNDIVFDSSDQQARFDVVTRRLWQTVLQGLGSAANSFDKNIR
jgi:hypothetical protein